MKIKKELIWLFVIAIIFNICFLLFYDKGPKASSDFSKIYGPVADQVSDYVKGTGDSVNLPHILKQHPTILFHLGYVAITALIFLIFGSGNIWALILFQIILASLIPVILYKIAEEFYANKKVAMIFSLVSIVFIDNVIWNNWASPEAVYRFFFVVYIYSFVTSYYSRQNSTWAKNLLFVLGYFVLLFIRIDTVILCLPIYVLLVVSSVKKNKMVLRSVAPVMLVGTLVTFLFIYYLPVMVQVLRSIYMNGDVIIQYTKIEPFDYSKDGNYFYILTRMVKLFFMRGYQFLNIFPPFWQKAHQYYYAAHMIPLYILFITALVKVIRQKNYKFMVYASIFICSLILHIITRVDAALRTSFTHLPFLILTAGYGFDYLFELFNKKKNKEAYKDLICSVQ
ncbi:MAG: hypothetical protein PHD29_01465 [bacterium]|nr:hypothetical protein [bacterium]MDD5756807.1 hypothetical protein [bacterium]